MVMIVEWLCSDLCFRSGRFVRSMSDARESPELLDLSWMQALVHLKPKRVAITGGYHGVHESLKVYQRSSRDPVKVIGIDDEFQPGDICWLETPLNPTGEAR